MRRTAERRRPPAAERPKGSGPRIRDPEAPALLFQVERLGNGGDGAARPVDPAQGTDVVFIPLTAPGDRVLARPTRRGWAVLQEVVTPSPLRTTPPCSLFGICGGCTLQHLPEAWVLDWKTARILDGLTHAGANDLPIPVVTHSAPGTRRRADLALRRRSESVTIGLHRRGGDPVDLTECHLLHPDILALLAPLRPLLTRLELLRRDGDLLINLLDSGPDLLLASDRTPSSVDRTQLAAFARQHGIARIAWRPAGRPDDVETLVQTGPPHIAFAGVTVTPPPDAFLQATRAGEAAISAAVTAALPPAPGRRAHVVELYAGCGTLTFPLAEHVRVEAFEGHAAALQALKQAATGHRVDAHVRDLNRQPVEARILSAALAVVLDPPYAGAGLQMTQILDACPDTIIYVSCNPAVLFRDAALLCAKGYRIDALTVIDQFLWSAEVETVCRFSRRKIRR